MTRPADASADYWMRANLRENISFSFEILFTETLILVEVVWWQNKFLSMPNIFFSNFFKLIFVCAL